MPKDISFISSAGKELTPSLTALYDRPLIWLLPFYMLGIYLGWSLDYGPVAKECLGFSLMTAGTVILLQIKAKPPFPDLAFNLFLPAAVLTLGWGLMAMSLAEPDEPHHLIHYTQEAGFSGTVILGGYVGEGSGGRPDRNYRLIIDAVEIIIPGDDGPEEIIPVTGQARLVVGGRLEVQEGDYLRLPVRLQRVSGFKNPGAMDYEKYWAAQGVRVSGFVKSPRLVTSWPEISRAGPVSGWRSRVTAFIEARVPAPASGILAAQLAGRRGLVDDKSEETFRVLGLSHLLAVSGLHLGVCYGASFWLWRLILRRLTFLSGRVRLNLAAASLAVVPALFYAALVGAASPVIRAAVMIFFVTLAAAALRRGDPWNILAAAGWLLLLIEPYRLFTASFQLSFVATAAMLAVFVRRPGAPLPEKPLPSLWNRPVDSALLKELIKKLKNQTVSPTAITAPPLSSGPTFLISAFKAALAGTLGTLPLVAWHFGQVSPAGLAANLIFPFIFSFLILIPGLAAVAVLPFSAEMAAWPLVLAGTILSGLMPLMESLAERAPNQPAVAPGLLFFVAWYLAGWIVLRSPRPLKYRAALGLAVLAAGLLPGLLSSPGDREVLRFTVLDVGQGSAVHLNLPDGRQMLIDGGGGYNFDPGDMLIRPYLLRQGLGRLDAVILTHPDQDHLKGLVTIAALFRPREVWTAPWPADYSSLYQSFLAAYPDSLRPSLAELRAGRNFGEARTELLWPPADLIWPASLPGGKWVNNHGLVIKVSWGDISFLITGDIERETEKALVDCCGPALKSTVLMAPHHGGQNSLSLEFLKAVQPAWVVFAAGRNNSYGLPHPEAVQRAGDYGAEIWRTDLAGAAVFEAVKENGRVALKPPAAE